MTPSRPGLLALVLCGGLTLLAALSAGGQETSRDKKIEAIENQLRELSRSLAELKKSGESSARPAEPEVSLSGNWLKELTWRSIGPANMGGRIVALSVYEPDPSLYWVATASGGLLKTENQGTTFTHQFDREPSVSIGDVCVAPSDRNVVWVGTGENNPRNSVSYGDGVYKSTDGGKTWKNMGLKETYQVGKILVHPRDPNIVYVGALGRLYGENPERGLYKTTDGGQTWSKILFVDDRTGVIDMRMHPTDPETLIVATYERQRDLYDTNDPSKKWGPGGGLHKTTDGGKTFKRLTRGLPTCPIGRVGIDWYRKDPNVVYLIVESEKIGMGVPPRRPAAAAGGGFLGMTGETQEDKAVISRVIENGPAAAGGLKAEDIILSLGDRAVRSYEDLQEQVRTMKPGTKVQIKVNRAGQPIDVQVSLGERPQGEPGSPAGGRARGGVDPQHPYGVALGGQRENAQDQQGPDGFQYGGVYRSTDAGESWTRINSINPRPMYFSQVRVDPSDDKYLYVLGVSLYRSSDGGKTFRPDGGRGVHADQHALWIDPRDGRHMLLGCDGGAYVTNDRMANWDHLNHAAIGQFYHVALDTRRDYRVYGGLQDNGSWGGPSRTHSLAGPVNEDWISVGGGDGFKCQVDPDDPDQIYFTSQNGALGRRHLRTGETAALRPRSAQGQTFRFNWNTPFLLSHENTRIYYTAGNYVFRSLGRGSDLRVISPEITRTDKGSATALAESPRNPNVLYVGTDDGALWVTRDGGKEWTEITKNVGLAGPRYVSTIEASRYEEGRAYVAFDGHRSNDDDPLVFATEDFGKTWASLRGNLPRGSTHCLREDIKNPSLLYTGTEFGFWASLDRGRTWNSLNTNLPTVAVFDLAIHPTAGEIVVATHGRSLWVLDVTPLRQTTRDVLQAEAHLFQPTSAIRWRTEPRRGQTNRRFVGQNPASGATIDYALARKAGKITLKILDVDGSTLRELRTSGEPGLHRIVWDLGQTVVQRPAPRVTERTEASRAPSGSRSGSGSGSVSESESEPGPSPTPARGPGGPGRMRPVPPAVYRVVLSVDGKDVSRTLRIEPDPSVPLADLLAADQNDEDADALFEEEEEGEEEEPVID